jgi:hypothetical protein
MDERVEAFVRDALKINGTRNEIVEGVRMRLPNYEELFRHDETEKHLKDKAAQKGLELLRARVVTEMQLREGLPIADQLKIVLSAIDSSAHR